MKFPVKIINDKRINPRLTSYEIICATARSEPIRAYFELDAQPEPRIEYTARLEMASTNKRARFRSRMG